MSSMQEAGKCLEELANDQTLPRCKGVRPQAVIAVPGDVSSHGCAGGHDNKTDFSPGLPGLEDSAFPFQRRSLPVVPAAFSWTCKSCSGEKMDALQHQSPGLVPRALAS